MNFLEISGYPRLYPYLSEVTILCAIGQIKPINRHKNFVAIKYGGRNENGTLKK